MDTISIYGKVKMGGTLYVASAGNENAKAARVQGV
jgi:hypothetical protein